MPLLVLSALISAFLGFTLRSSATAYAVAAGLGLLGVVQMVWAVTDGKGDDPWPLVLIGIAGLAVNVGIVAATRRMRPARTA
jgi:uncharacterized membrane protein HdeD (DUF308 family)